SEEHTSELQSLTNLVCRLLLEKKKKCAKAYPRAPAPPHAVTVEPRPEVSGPALRCAPLRARRCAWPYVSHTCDLQPHPARRHSPRTLPRTSRTHAPTALPSLTSTPAHSPCPPCLCRSLDAHLPESSLLPLHVPSPLPFLFFFL